jgi:hypothetical protein
MKAQIARIGITIGCLMAGAACSSGDGKDATGQPTTDTMNPGAATVGGQQQPAPTGAAGIGTPAATTGNNMMAGSGGSASKPSNTDPNTVMPPATTDKPTLDAKTPFSEVPAQCQGLKVVGMKNSPGGSVLPNTCAPFDGEFNNPYAIRCIDANPDFKTKYTGDEYCILPPAEDKGTQVHVGPADYNNPGEFEFAPDSEINTYYYINSANAESHYYYRANWRMRPGSHHMIISLMDADRGDGWADSSEAGTDRGVGGKSFGGAQRTDVDRPQGTLDIPPENVGLGGELAANQQFSFNLHHANASDKPILREAWVNIWYIDKKDVTKPMTGLTGFGSPLDVAVAPGESAELEYKCTPAGATRIISLLGHRHVSTDRFAAWVVKASGEKIDAYESFSWEDIPTYQYDSVSKNPVPDVANKVDGASSGMLELAPGDELHFECDIHNQQAQTLKFANELYTGEMCILFGSYTGASPCSGAQRVPH